MDFIRHTAKRLQRYVAGKRAALGALIKFGAVGASGVLVNNGMLWFLTRGGGPEIVASIVATETAILTNFIGNDLWTWKGHAEKQWWHRFLLFQGISLFAGVITVLLFLGFREFTPLPLLAANTLAILFTFIINFSLNSKLTWRSSTTQPRGVPRERFKLKFLMWIVFASLLAMLLGAQSASALVSVSQMGFHPAGTKMVTVYTSASTGSFSVVRADGTVVKTASLTRPQDFFGTAVNCQGNNPCLVGDFSNLTASGTYHIETGLGEQSASFPIRTTVYRENVPLFNEYFDALSQQGSSYHADMNGATDPGFPMMADGSFIMTSDQAALTLIRLGDAYRRNPVLLSSDTKTFVRSNTPDIIEHMIMYAEYLEDLQDVKIQSRTDGVGFRLSTGLVITGAFVPGETNLTSLTIYDSSEGHRTIDTLPIVSLCANLTGSAHDTCLGDAATYYKCQADEPCITLDYSAATGTRILGQTDGFGVDNGWTYEFGCYYDVDLQQGNFNDGPNPCFVYDRTENREQTVTTLLAYTEAITGINQYDPTKAQELLDRAVQTHEYIGTTYAAFTATDNDTAAWGSANFLLYDLTQDSSYLNEAHASRSLVSQILVSDRTRGEEFYWQEYVRHQQAILDAGLIYLLDGTDPSEFFRGKMYGDFKDKGALSIAANGERVYQFDPNIQFHNSRYMLTEALLASKTKELSADNATLIQTIADSQLAWLTGNNGVDFDSGFTNDIRSISFIFGVGTFPEQFHSRYLMSTGYAQSSDGEIIGMRGTGVVFFNGTEYIGLDGKTTILGTVLGAQGNGYHGETSAPTFDIDQAFINGETYIPGWINGAFDLKDDTDDIFNYDDNLLTYEFTESTNEIVATAISLFAYLDAQYNGVTALEVPVLTGIGVGSAQVNVTSNPVGTAVYFDGIYKGMTMTLTNLSFNASSGSHTLLLQMISCQNSSTELSLAPGQSVAVNILMDCTNSTMNSTGNTTGGGDATITLLTSPSGANVTLDGASENATPISVQLGAGQHNVTFSKQGYAVLATSFNVTAGTAATHTFLLDSSTAPYLLMSRTNATLHNGTYSVFELTTVEFMVQYDRNSTIQWYADGVLQRSTQQDRDTFTWTPDILTTSNTRDVVIEAVGDGQTNATFTLGVMNYLNPFWEDSVGSSDAILHVFSNNFARNFTSMIVEIEDTRRHNVTLSYEYTNPEETDWKAQLTDMANGNTYIRKIFVVDNETASTQEIPVPQDRAHYRQTASQSSSSKRSGGGGGGGGIIGSECASPELVYAVFSKDVIAEGESIELRADAKTACEIVEVTAVLADSEGTARTLQLSLIQGSSGYGTWSALITGPAPGRHGLAQIMIVDNSGVSATVDALDSSFFVTSDTVLSSEHLSLVYVLLNRNFINPGESVSVKLDARDYDGITKVGARFKAIDGKEQDLTVPLSLTAGTGQYGTWEGDAALERADTTYSLTAITLSNKGQSQEIAVYNQRVYVNYTQSDASLLTGMAVGDAGGWTLIDFAKNPATPLLIGIGGMFLAMFIAGAITLQKRKHM